MYRGCYYQLSKLILFTVYCLLFIGALISSKTTNSKLDMLLLYSLVAYGPLKTSARKICVFPEFAKEKISERAPLLLAGDGEELANTRRNSLDGTSAQHSIHHMVDANLVTIALRKFKCYNVKIFKLKLKTSRVQSSQEI